LIILLHEYYLSNVPLWMEHSDLVKIPWFTTTHNLKPEWLCKISLYEEI
jgi:hypothetical protein